MYKSDPAIKVTIMKPITGLLISTFDELESGFDTSPPLIHHYYYFNVILYGSQRLDIYYKYFDLIVIKCQAVVIHTKY